MSFVIVLVIFSQILTCIVAEEGADAYWEQNERENALILAQRRCRSREKFHLSRNGGFVPCNLSASANGTRVLLEVNGDPVAERLAKYDSRLLGFNLSAAAIKELVDESAEGADVNCIAGEKQACLIALLDFPCDALPQIAPVEPAVPYTGGSMRLTCKNTPTSKPVSWNTCEWYKIQNGREVKQDTIPSYSSTVRISVVLKIFELKLTDSGVYRCYCHCDLLTNNYKDVAVNITESLPPYFLASPSSAELHVKFGDQLNLSCPVYGIPDPKIVWLKDHDDLPENANWNRSDDGRELQFFWRFNVTKSVLTCRASNDFGTKEHDFNLFGDSVMVQAITTHQAHIFGPALAVTCAIALILAIVFAVVYRAQERKKAELLRQICTQVEEAASKAEKDFTLNPEIASQDQVDQMPYDRNRYELPSESLRTGSGVLGVGTFGVVSRGKLLLSEETTIDVAIKRPREHKNPEHVKALFDELRMLGYLGKHINVLNLLGAITIDIKDGQILVVLELCDGGDLLSHLHKQARFFVSEFHQPSQAAVHSPYVSPNTPTHYETQLYDTVLDPARQHFSTFDLLSYGYQIASGVEYLMSRNFIHRDLAARNIPLAKGVCKISDFGLARNGSEYLVVDSKHGMVPVRWIAIESFKFHYSSMSDIWSFGVVLWEIFTFGEVPYADLLPDGRSVRLELREYLESGGRLCSPAFASPEVFGLMNECWQEDPRERPSATECKVALREELIACGPQRFQRLETSLRSATMADIRAEQLNTYEKVVPSQKISHESNSLPNRAYEMPLLPRSADRKDSRQMSIGRLLNV